MWNHCCFEIPKFWEGHTKTKSPSLFEFYILNVKSKRKILHISVVLSEYIKFFSDSFPFANFIFLHFGHFSCVICFMMCPVCLLPCKMSTFLKKETNIKDDCGHLRRPKYKKTNYQNEMNRISKFKWHSNKNVLAIVQ